LPAAGLNKLSEAHTSSFSPGAIDIALLTRILEVAGGMELWSTLSSKNRATLVARAYDVLLAEQKGTSKAAILRIIKRSPA
jgi:hypothetical protein